ncbi:MAG: T9SS type A sorting domain-containing protein [Cytophagales bacterium]|nr:T9SS type A sorting domain-containing protein [Cytophagales bacterium]MDW8385115.1 T9SS type A sorting domain-containing protein [Flammeovirgaceae bacterium]
MKHVLLLVVVFFFANDSYGVTRLVSSTGSNVGDCTLFPCATLVYAHSQASNGDTINVAAGTYLNVALTITKSIVLRGNGGAPNPRPTLQTNTSDMITVEAPNVVIENFDILLGFTATSGFCGIVHRSSNSIDGLIIQDNIIRTSAFAFASVNYNAYGIQLYHNTSFPGVTNSVNHVIIRRNVIGEENVMRPFFGRGIMLGDGNNGEAPQGIVGGNTSSQGNTIVAYYAIQIVHNVSAPTTIMRNTITGEVTVTKPFHTVNIDSNLFTVSNALVRAQLGVYVHIKEVNNPAQVNVRYNRFNNFENVGVFSGGSRNVVLRGNRYDPVSGLNKNYICVFANTKYRTTGVQPLPTFSNSISITLDTFNLVNPATGFIGYGVVFGNHISGGVNPPFNNVVLGGTSANSNVFNGVFNTRVRAITMDYHTAMTNATNSPPDTNPFYNLWNDPPATPASDMAPCNFVLDAKENIFEWAPGIKSRPYETEATLARLLDLEDKIIHRSDYDSLGFVRILPNRSYSTPNSYIPLISSTVNLNYAVNHGEVANGDTVYVQSNATAYNQPTSPVFSFNKRITLKTTAAYTPIRSIQINHGDTLFINNDIEVTSSLTLTNGIIQTLGSASITLGSSVPDLSETTSSHVIGRVQATRNVGTGSLDYLGVVLPSGANLGNLQIVRITGPNGITTIGPYSSIATLWDLTPDNNVGRNNVQFKFLPIWLNGKNTSTLSVWKQEGTNPWTLQMSPTPAASTSPLVVTQPFNITSFSKWTISDLVNPLPISLLDFSAKRMGRYVLLAWTASFNSGENIFVVEKSSDGTNFFAVGEVTADAPFKVYNFLDTDASVSAYYRLKMFNNTYSHLVFVPSDEISIRLYPTLVQQSVHLEYDALLKSKYIHFEVVDMIGRTQAQLYTTPERLETILPSIVGGLRAGIYAVKFKTPEKTFSQRIIKE